MLKKLSGNDKDELKGFLNFITSFIAGYETGHFNH
jgi:hypothetical protein